MLLRQTFSLHMIIMQTAIDMSSTSQAQHFQHKHPLSPQKHKHGARRTITSTTTVMVPHPFDDTRLKMTTVVRGTSPSIVERQWLSGVPLHTPTPGGPCAPICVMFNLDGTCRGWSTCPQRSNGELNMQFGCQTLALMMVLLWFGGWMLLRRRV